MSSASSNFAWRVVWASLVAALVIGVNTVLLRAEPVTVSLLSGRKFTAEIDARSNPERLWLRFDHAQGTILRPIEWDRVVSAQQGEKTFTADELRGSLDNLKTARTAELPTPPSPDIRSPSDAVVIPTPAPSQSPLTTHPSPLTPPRVRSLRIDAYLANFNDTAEADGLVVNAYPLDARGNVLPVTGTLEVELTGVIPNDFENTNEFQRIGRWVNMVRADDVGVEGAAFDLPFQAVHPEFNLDYAPKGIVHATLSIPGQGSFEANTGAIRIRAYNPIRDRLEEREGTRFFPTERTSRGERN